MSILRNKLKSQFSQLPNELITDTRLSHGAFRVMAYLFSRPDGWEVLNTDIQNQLGINQPQTLANYWKELIDSGWLKRERKREGGKIVGGFDYELNLIMENPQYGKSINRENPTLGKIHTLNNTESNTNTDSNNNNELKAPKGASSKKRNLKTKKTTLTKNAHLIQSMATDFDVAYSHLSDPKNNNLYWGAAAAEKIRWSGKEIGNIAHLRDALQKRMSDRGIESTDENTVKNWRMFLEMAISLNDDYLNRNFTPSVLYSQFNSIILKLNQKRNGVNNNRNTSPTAKDIIPDSTVRTVMENLHREGFFDQ